MLLYKRKERLVRDDWRVAQLPTWSTATGCPIEASCPSLERATRFLKTQLHCRCDEKRHCVAEALMERRVSPGALPLCLPLLRQIQNFLESENSSTLQIILRITPFTNFPKIWEK